MPEAVTRNVRVRVESEFAPGRSSPAQNKWFFLYTIRITNEGRETVKLLSRHWIITDAMGDVREVRGPGRRRQAAGARARRELRIHLRLRPDHAVRHDAGNLPDGDRRARRLRNRDSRRSRSPNRTRRSIRAVRQTPFAYRSFRRSHRQSDGTRPRARRRCRAAS